MRDNLFAVWLTVNLNFSVSVRKILESHTPDQIYKMTENELLNLGFSQNFAKKLSDKDITRAERIVTICRHSQIDIIPFWDERYPDNLRDAPHAPIVIYTKGNVEGLRNGLKVGFVGTRTTSVRGREFSTRLCEELVAKRAILVSGGASGTDSYALIEAVEKGVFCAAVLGCDINDYFPAKNYSLFECVSRCGVVISEYPPGTNARWFPERNRIIAALSDRLVVAEAPEKSGALITANYAAAYNKPVFAPDIEGEGHAGCRNLLKLGAHEVRCADDVILNSAPTPFKLEIKNVKKESVKKTCKNKNIKKLPEPKVFDSPDLTYVYSCILSGRDTVEKMVDAEHRVSRVMCAVSALELEGEITACPGGRYRIVL